MEYLSNELSALTFAHNYYSWIFKEFSAYVGKVILEVGAGIGTFSSFLLRAHSDRVLLLEPSRNLSRQVKHCFRQIKVTLFFFSLYPLGFIMHHKEQKGFLFRHSLAS